MASATFKCLTSGNTVTFTEQVDIDSMKGHPEYEQVFAEALPEPIVKEIKKPGRPKKAEATLEAE